MSVVRPEKVDVLHVEAQAEVALDGLDPVAARALGVFELAERQGAELGPQPLGELILLGDQVLPPGALPVVEVVPTQFPTGKRDVLLLHEHRGPRPTVARRNRDRGVGDICHETAGKTEILVQVNLYGLSGVLSPDGIDMLQLYILVENGFFLLISDIFRRIVFR